MGRWKSDITEVNITEKRAPTDDSVRIAEEFREKALSSILASGRDPMGANLFRWFSIARSEWGGIDFMYCVEVDGREHSGVVKIDRYDIHSGSPEQSCDLIAGKIADSVRATVSEAIHRELFRAAACEIAKNFEVARKSRS